MTSNPIGFPVYPNPANALGDPKRCRTEKNAVRMCWTMLLSNLCIIAWCGLLGIVETGFAQPGGGGRGSRGGFGGFSSYSRELQSDDVQSELSLTDEQKERVRAAVDAEEAARNEIRDSMRQLFGIQDPAEQLRLRTELQTKQEELDLRVLKSLEGVLTAEQLLRVKQISWQRMGQNALLRGDAAAAAGLDDGQKKQLQTLLFERDQARMALGFRASEEQQAAFNAEWEGKFNDLIPERQRERWATAQGAVAPERQFGGRGPGGGPGFGPPGTPPGPRTVETPRPVRPEAPIAAPVDPSQVMSSMDATNPNAAGKFSFSFRFAPWEDVLSLFAEKAGMTLDLTDVPAGTFNYLDSKTYTATEALDILNGYLLQKGYILVQRDQFLVCVNIDQGVPPNLVPYVSVDDLPKRGRNELMTVVFPIKGLDLDVLARQVSDLLGPQGKATGLSAASAVVVTDIGNNLRRVQQLLTAMSALQGPDDVEFRSYKLVHLDVVEAEQTVRNILGLSQGVKNVSAAMERNDRGAAPRTDAGLTATQLAKTQFAAEPRTGQLLVTAPLAVHKLIETALKAIDVEIDPNAPGGANRNRKYLQVYSLTSTDAGEVAKSIDVLMPGVVVNEDRSSRRVHIFATQDQHREIEGLIRQFDGMGAASQAVCVITLSNMDPTLAAGTLRSLFLREGDKAPSIETDIVGRRLMIRGSAEQVTQIKLLLTQLGEDGSGDRSASLLGPVRRVPLSGRDPDEVLELLQESWKVRSPNPIRVVPANERNRGESKKSRVQVPERTRDAKRAAPPVAPAAPVGVDPYDVRVAPPPPAAKTAMFERRLQGPEFFRTIAMQAAEDKPEITVRVEEGELIIVSKDEQALDDFEELLRQTLQAVLPQTNWSVFTLQRADAAETAKILEQLIANVSVAKIKSSSSGGDMFGLGAVADLSSNLISASGMDALGRSAQTLRIIPEPRLNALFVSGPPVKVQELEQLLDVLDATDLAESLRDRLPRMVKIEHAEVTEVYRIVKDVYKDYLESNPLAALGGGGGGNMLQMLMGGRGGGGGGGIDPSALPQVKMTLGMDEQTGHIIVSANDELFSEVETMIQSLDKAALDARKTLRVVNLQHATPAMIQGTMSSLFPRVKMSVSGGRRRAGSEGGSGALSSSPPVATSSPSQTPPNQEAIRQFFEQRMREQMRSGGIAPGAPGSGGPPATGGAAPGSAAPGGRSGRGR